MGTHNAIRESNYKISHEEFMQNLNGTTVTETTLVGLSAPFTVFVARSLILNLFVRWPQFKSTSSVFLIEFCLLIFPLTLCFTVLSDVAHNVLILFVSLSLGYVFIEILRVKFSSYQRFLNSLMNTAILDKRRAYITNFRASVNLMTAICILAVDFQIFPRRFAKTENFGYSLMDTGVGLYCIANAIITPEALGIKKNLNRSSSLIKSFKSSVPLIVLGVARFFTTQQIDYQMHVSEYGVHWNFFITLAVVKLLCAIILTYVNGKHSLLISIVVISVHETLLYSGISGWVLSETPRIGLLAANREGVVSSLGYVALFFAGISFGQLLQRQMQLFKDNLVLEFYLIVLSTTLWVFSNWGEQYFGVSRRLANAGYYLWLLAYSVTLMSFYLFIELMCFTLDSIQKFKFKRKDFPNKESLVPIVLDGISNNGLFFFLLANLLTGLINVSIHTLQQNSLHSIIIINCYLFVICSITVLINRKGLKLKLW